MVLMTADTVGGVWQYALQLSRRLAADHGWRIELATMGAPLSASQRREAASISNLGLHEASHRLEWMEQPWEDVARAGEWLLSLERRLNPDVVHLNQYAFGALPFSAPTLLVAHSCVVSWWQAVHGADPPESQWRRYRQVVRQGVAGADMVAAPTRSMLMSLVRNHRHDGNGIVLPNGCDPERHLPGRKKPVIVSAGRLWDEAKNLRALERVAGDLPWPIEVAGAVRHPGILPSGRAGGAEPAHEERDEEEPADGGQGRQSGREGAHGQRGGLRLLGVLSAEQMAERLATAAVYAHPARYEPFGLAPLEAALAGCALVLGDLPSLRETWGDAAVYAPAQDHGALRAALLGLIDDPDLREEMARRAREVGLRHSGHAMARNYLAAYRRLVRIRLEDSQCAS
jgi:glycosyltransferase involved in cell wall biosynthesis